jgi:PKD repeat protein
MPRFDGKTFIITILTLAIAFVASACNLTSAPQESLSVTDVPTTTLLPSRTPLGGNAITVTPLPVVTGGNQSGGQRPTSVVVLPPTAIAFPTSTQMPVSIVILSPIPGNIVAGNVQVLGAAIHPQFLQYQLEFGPDPNPSNLWYPASGIVQTPVLNGLLGIWQTNTGASPDGIYQLRLRLYLRDGTSLATIVNSIRIQNQQPTPVPTATTVTVPRPIAAFTQDRATGQAPLVVRFTNQSTGSISQHNWDFGDGSTATDVNPSHTFRNPGVYTVRLRVRGPGGNSNVSREINVQSPTAPVAGFVQDVTAGPSPLTVKFTNQSTGNITSQQWNFGDGESSTEASPTHIFQAVGTYNVILTVTGPGGSTSVTRQITVQNPSIPAPLAGLVASATEGDAPLTVQFDATDSSGQIDTYNWDFGDGQTGNGQVVTHTYTTPGPYQASLTVVGPGGQAKASVTINVTQQPDAPTAAFTASTNSGTTPLTVEFNGSTSIGQIDSYSWNFGDGQTGNGTVISHTFTTAATYTVQLTVTGAGGSHTTSVDVNATDPIAAPVAAFDGQPNTGTAALDVQFTNLSTGDISGFAWDFSDGGSSTDRDPLHRFEAAGNYIVILTATGPGGQSSAEMTISVSPPVVVVPPVAAFDAVPTSGNAPLTVQFNATIADNIASYDWNFGDNVGIANGSSVGYTFNAAGDFVVTLTVTGSDGQQASQQMSINVSEVVQQPPPESLAQQIPILPDFDQPDLQPRLRAIYENGLGQGKRASVFAIIGDDLARQPGYLTPFADPGLDVSGAGFQEIVDWYRQTILGEHNSFSRSSAAAQANWRVQDILDPSRSDPSRCNAGETPLDCEMRLIQPTVAIISVGYNDVFSNTDPNAFRGTMEQIIQTLLNNGVIPVVTTVQPIPGMEAQADAINNAIIQAAQNVEANNGMTVLIYNLWRRFSQLPGNGLSGDNATPSVAPTGAGDLSDDAVGNFGMNARNRNTLRLLSELRSRVFSDATS